MLVLPTEAEGFPNVILEAMAKGLAIIATDVGGISDSVKNDYNGYLLHSNDVNEIICSMKKYLLDKFLITVHSKNSIHVVENNHNIESNCKELVQFLNNGERQI